MGGEEGLILKFVDDMKLIKGISSMKDVEDTQDSLEKLYQWQEKIT